MRVANDKKSYCVLIGHSFGGLILERALAQSLTSLIAADEASPQPSDHETPTLHSPADLIVFVNSAAPATESKQLLDLLKTHHLRHQIQSEKRGWRDEPALLSITSTGGQATGLAMPLGQAPSKLTKAMRQYDLGTKIFFLTEQSIKQIQAQAVPTNVTDRLVKIKERPGLEEREFLALLRGILSQEEMGKYAVLILQAAESELQYPPREANQSAYYLHSTANLPVLQSHEIVQMKTAAEVAKAESRAYKCFRLQGQTYCILAKESRWNDTPYWVMQMPVEFVPDHGAIFRQEFRLLLSQFLPEEEMQNLEQRSLRNPQLQKRPAPTRAPAQQP